MQVRSISAANNVNKVATKIYSVAEAMAALKLNSKLKVTLRDTPANITNNLNALKNIQAQITQITLPNANDKLNLNGAQLKDFEKLRSHTYKTTYGIDGWFETTDEVTESETLNSSDILRMYLYALEYVF